MTARIKQACRLAASLLNSIGTDSPRTLYHVTWPEHDDWPSVDHGCYPRKPGV
jgi:hypothetical protein